MDKEIIIRRIRKMLIEQLHDVKDYDNLFEDIQELLYDLDGTNGG